MKALVTGANGMLGSSLCLELSRLKFRILATDILSINEDRAFLDIRDPDAVKSAFKEFKPEIVFHLAAATDVDRCETEHEHASSTNARGTENISRCCAESDITMVYISTAAVFDGKKREPYIEFDQPNPLNFYAKTKLEGEKIVEGLLKKYFILRAGWMIGGIQKDKKFVLKIINQLQTKNEILAVTDKIGSPTFTDDFSNCMIPLVLTKKYGLYHMANKGNCSRYDIAKMIVKFMDREEVAVKPVTSDAFPLRAPRPDMEAIDNYKLNLLGMNTMRPWQVALGEYVNIVKNSPELLRTT